MRCTFRYWTARLTLQLWFCRAVWHSSVVTPCTISCTWGGACDYCLLPPLGSEKPLTEAGDHQGYPHPRFCLQGALSAWCWDHSHPWDLKSLWAWVGHNIPSLERPRGP